MSIFWPLLKRQFFALKTIVVYLKYPKTIFSDITSVKKQRSENFRFLDKIHGLTPLENVNFLALFKTSI